MTEQTFVTTLGFMHTVPLRLYRAVGTPRATAIWLCSLISDLFSQLTFILKPFTLMQFNKKYSINEKTSEHLSDQGKIFSSIWSLSTAHTTSGMCECFPCRQPW